MSKSILLITLCFYVSVNAHTQVQYSSWNKIETLQFGRETIYKNPQDIPLDGDYKLSKPTRAYSEVHFKKGKIHGHYIDYDSKGRIEKEAYYKEGRLEGESRYYHQNGAISRIAHFENGKETGTWKKYDEEGIVISVENYTQGKKHGKWTKTIQYPQNGTKAFVTEYYKNDSPTGRWEERNEKNQLHWTRDYIDAGSYTETKYHVNGKKSGIKTLVNWKLEGKILQFSKAGILLDEKKYQQDQLVAHKSYFEDGKPKEVIHYEQGKKSGGYQLFSDKGIKICEGHYKDNLKHGTWKEFREKEGTLHRVQVYDNDEKHGLYTEYNLADNVSSKGNYVHNKQDGTWREYDLRGKLTKEIEYEMGKRLSEKVIDQ